MKGLKNLGASQEVYEGLGETERTRIECPECGHAWDLLSPRGIQKLLDVSYTAINNWMRHYGLRSEKVLSARAVRADDLVVFLKELWKDRIDTTKEEGNEDNG